MTQHTEDSRDSEKSETHLIRSREGKFPRNVRRESPLGNRGLPGAGVTRVINYTNETAFPPENSTPKDGLGL